MNDFDVVCRRLVRLDPLGLWGWLCPRLCRHYRFVDWIDTRTTPEFGESEPTLDTLARLESLDRPGEPWAFLTEFLTEPDLNHDGRLMSYLGNAWRDLRPDNLPGSRYRLLACTIALTGTASRGIADDPGIEEGVMIRFTPLVRNLGSYDAEATLAGIAAGSLSWSVLSWVPLLRGAESAIIRSTWRDLLGKVPNVSDAREWATAACVLAEKKLLAVEYRRSAEDVMSQRSVLLDEYRAEGRLVERRENILVVLNKRFGNDALRFTERLDQITDLQHLGELRESAFDCVDLAAFEEQLHD